MGFLDGLSVRRECLEDLFVLPLRAASAVDVQLGRCSVLRYSVVEAQAPGSGSCSDP